MNRLWNIVASVAPCNAEVLLLRLLRSHLALCHLLYAFNPHRGICVSEVEDVLALVLVLGVNHRSVFVIDGGHLVVQFLQFLYHLVLPRPEFALHVHHDFLCCRHLRILLFRLRLLPSLLSGLRPPVPCSRRCGSSRHPATSEGRSAGCHSWCWCSRGLRLPCGWGWSGSFLSACCKWLSFSFPRFRFLDYLKWRSTWRYESKYWDLPRLICYAPIATPSWILWNGSWISRTLSAERKFSWYWDKYGQLKACSLWEWFCIWCNPCFSSHFFKYWGCRGIHHF